MVVFAIIFGAMPGETVGMRTLRTLPLSTAKLAALLLTVPIVLGFACAAFIATAGGMIEPVPAGPLAFLAEALVIASAGRLALAICLHIVSAARILVLMFFAFLPASVLYLANKFVLLAILGGGAAIVLAFFLLVRGLRKSNAFYQPRRFFGVKYGPAARGAVAGAVELAVGYSHSWRGSRRGDWRGSRAGCGRRRAGRAFRR